MKTSPYATLTPKKKCCKSTPRCKKCPLVLNAVRKAESSGVCGDELDALYRRARRLKS